MDRAKGKDTLSQGRGGAPARLTAALVTADAVSAQLGPAYGRFGEADRSRHVELLRSIRRPEDVALHAEQTGHCEWTVTVCTSDCLGALAAIAGLSAAYRFDIRSADVFTTRFAPRPGPAGPPRTSRKRRLPSFLAPPARPPGRILDIFRVAVPGQGDGDVWQRFREDLAGLMVLLVEGHQQRAREQVVERVSDAARTTGESFGPLLPVSIDLSNDASPDFTQLTIGSGDTFGFLFAFTNALAVLNVNIERAEIRTLALEVRDTFWLTDQWGRKILAEERLSELRAATVLIKHFTHLLPRSPNPAQALGQFNALTRQLLSRPDWTEGLQDLESTQVLETIAELMGVSRFLWEDFLRMQHENLFPVLLDTPALEQPKTEELLGESLKRRLADLKDDSDRVQEINGFKDREMFRIDLRHITRRIDFRAFSRELSELAQTVIAEVANLSYSTLETRSGAPTLDDGRPCPWCICALGKFGGRELGFGSDVELIVVYEIEGTTQGTTDGAHSVENSYYFGDFVRTCLSTLVARREGIFEVDLRLRPYGESGALASSLEGFNEYYSVGGSARQFERMALVKLRPVAGDPRLGERIVRSRDAFVYSGTPLDVENVLHLRHRQASELVPRGSVNAKYSPGGLVDIEYYVQAWQIAVGHLDPGVRVTNTLDALGRLARGGWLGAERAEELGQAYGFLRRLIDALRVVRGHAKDLTIPAVAEREFEYLARRLQLESASRLDEAITAWMALAGAVWQDAIPVAPR